MNVSKEAREAAAHLSKSSEGDWITPEHTRRCCDGRNDEFSFVQAFAKFEAEITQRVRDEALEEAARMASSMYVRDAFRFDFGHDIATAIRQMIGGKA